MGRYKCCAENCESSSDSDIKFFKFPVYNPKKLKRWLQSMKREDWTPSRFSVLCINHFEEQQVDRTGKCITLREEAVPSIFTPADTTQSLTPAQVSNKDSVVSSRSKPGRVHRGRPSKTRDKNSEGEQAEEPEAEEPEAEEPEAEEPEAEEPEAEEEPAPEREGETSRRWSIIVDEELMKIDSFPHFFHGNYCVSQDIQWAPDDNPSTEAKGPSSLIEVTGSWQWLGLDVRGPLPETSSGHRYILSVTDYFSKWVEAWPLESFVPENVVEHMVEMINHFGFPLRILSRLPRDTVNKMNTQLKAQMKVAVPLMVHHHQTGSVDLTTQQMVDRMVNELVEQRPSDWDIYLPAKVFSLCFQEHSSTKKRPFTLLCCEGAAPVHSPRALELKDNSIKDCDFVVR